MVGGGQEGGLRSGTENLPGIAAAAVAIELAVTEQAEYAARTRPLMQSLWEKIRAAIPEAQLVGPAIESPGRLPNTLCVLLPGRDGRVLVPSLDLAAGPLDAFDQVADSVFIYEIGPHPDALPESLQVG